MAVKKKDAVKEEKVVKKKKKEEKIEDTTRIRIDDSRINDADSLDVSFMEGKKNNVNKEKILKEKKDHSIFYSILKGFIFILVIATLLVFLYMYARDNNLIEKIFKVNPTVVKEEKKEENNIKKMDYNYLFIGDYHTQGMEFIDFYKPYVKVSNDDYTTSDILDDLKDYIYIYNPSDVFIELGINDFNEETSVKDIVDNIESIVNGIKLNRSMANIYIESLYPINDTIDGYDNDIDKSLIEDVNKELELMCKRLDITYVDMYKELSENGLLKEEYTEDGISLNDDGYKRVFKVINGLLE